MLTTYIPDSHMLTFSLSPACWTLPPAWALAWKKSFWHQPNASQLSQICLENFSVSLEKQVSFSGQSENKENILQS